MVDIGWDIVAFFAVMAPIVPHYFFLFRFVPKLQKDRQEFVFIFTCFTVLVLTGLVWLLKNRFGFESVFPQVVMTLVFLAALNIRFSFKYPTK